MKQRVVLTKQGVLFKAVANSVKAKRNITGNGADRMTPASKQAEVYKKSLYNAVEAFSFSDGLKIISFYHL